MGAEGKESSSSSASERSTPKLDWSKAASLDFWQQKIKATPNLLERYRKAERQAWITKIANPYAGIDPSELNKIDPSTLEAALTQRIENLKKAQTIGISEVIGFQVILGSKNINFEGLNGFRHAPSWALAEAALTLIEVEESKRYRTQAVAEAENPEPVRAALGYTADLREQHPGQYSIDPYSGYTSKVDPVRRVIIHAKHTNELLKVFYQLNALCKHTSEKLEAYLDEKLNNSGEGHAVPFIEVLSNLGVIYDPRFRAIAIFLRDYIFEMYDTVAEAEQDWRFSTFQVDAVFWKEGELKKNRGMTNLALNSHRTLQERENNPDKQEAHILPSIASWDNTIRANRFTARKVKKLNPAGIITDVLTKSTRQSSLESKVATVREARITRSLLIQEHSLTQKNLLTTTFAHYKSVFKEIIQQEEYLEQDSDLFVAHLQALCASYQDDPQLRANSRTLLTAFALHGEDMQGEYHIQVANFIDNPLFAWLGRHYKKCNFDLTKQPAEHVLLTKILVYELIQKVTGQHENDFLLIDSLEMKTKDLARSNEFFTALLQTVKAEINEEDFLEKNYQSIHDLLGPESVRKRKKRAREWQTFKLAGRVRFPYHFDVSYTFLRNSGITLAVLGGLIGAGIALSNVYPPSVSSQTLQNYDFPESRVPVYGSEDWQSTDELMANPPDRLDREKLSQVAPRKYLESVNLPDNQAIKNGESLAFFPQHIGTSFDIKTSEGIEVVQISDAVDIYIRPHQLAFELASPSAWIYPPEGYKLVAAYQQGGEKPYYKKSYQLAYDSVISAPYEKLILVAEPLQKKVSIDTEGNILTGVTVYTDPDLRSEVETIEVAEDFTDIFKFNEAIMQRLNDQLQPSPFKDLHTAFMTDYKKAVLGQMLGEGSDVTIDRDKISEVIEIYASKYYQLIQETRYYSLDFNDGLESSRNDFVRVANSPESGFYCSIAAAAFDDFLEGTGLDSDFYTGSSVGYYDGEGWIHFGHVKNLIHLPNGNQLIVDTTPPTTEKTPQEDIDALEQKGPEDAPINYKELLNQLLKNVLAGGVTAVGITALAGAVFSLYGYKNTRQQLEIFNKLRILAEKDLAILPNEQAILFTVVHALTKLSLQGDRESYIDQTVAILTLINRVNLAESAEFITWMSGRTGLLSKMRRIGTNYSHTENQEEVYEHILKEIKNECTQNPKFIEHVIPPSKQQYFNDAISHQDFSQTSLPSEICDLFDLAILTAKMEIVDTMNYFDEFTHSNLSIRQEEERTILAHLDQKEKSSIIQATIGQLSQTSWSNPTNPTNLAFVLKAVSQ